MATPDDLVFTESVDASSLPGETPAEHLVASAAVVEERRHRSESVARTGSGQVLTPAGFADSALDLHPATGVAIAARSLEASAAWGLDPGADYVARHWITAPAEDPQNFLPLEVPLWSQLYSGRRDTDHGVVARPIGCFGNVCDVRLSPDGGTAVSLQWFQGPVRSVSALITQELGTSEQRFVTRLPGSGEEFGDLSPSPDGRYVIAGSPTPQLVDLSTGHCAGFGSEYRAATWYPAAGSSCVLAVTGDHEHPPWNLVVLDLSTFDTEQIAALPRRTDGVQVSADGTLVVRTKPEDERGWFDQLQVTTDMGRTFQSVMPLHGASGWRRRTSRARWVERVDRPSSEVVLDSHFEEFFRGAQPDNTMVPEEQSWLLDIAAGQIKHRVLRLRAGVDAPDLLIAQLYALVSLPALYDAEMLRSVAEQVVPVVEHAARSDFGRHVAGLISEVADHRRPPLFSLAYTTI